MASTSIYRQQLLGRLGIPFTSIAPGVIESAMPGETPRNLAIRLAREKARAVAVRHPDAWCIGSDQVAMLEHPTGGVIALGKPGTAERCRQQLQQCAGRPVQFLTAVAIARHTDDALHEFIDMTEVRFRELDGDTIARYVERERPFDCAGGFKSEALGITLCESIESADPTALIGLPLIRLSAALRIVGYSAP